ICIARPKKRQGRLRSWRDPPRIGGKGRWPGAADLANWRFGVGRESRSLGVGGASQHSGASIVRVATSVKNLSSALLLVLSISTLAACTGMAPAQEPAPTNASPTSSMPGEFYKPRLITG